MVAATICSAMAASTISAGCVLATGRLMAPSTTVARVTRRIRTLRMSLLTLELRRRSRNTSTTLSGLVTFFIPFFLYLYFISYNIFLYSGRIMPRACVWKSKLCREFANEFSAKLWLALKELGSIGNVFWMLRLCLLAAVTHSSTHTPMLIIWNRDLGKNWYRLVYFLYYCFYSVDFIYCSFLAQFEYQQAQLEAEIENLSWKVERAETTDRGDLGIQMDVCEKRRTTLLQDFLES